MSLCSRWGTTLHKQKLSFVFPPGSLTHHYGFCAPNPDRCFTWIENGQSGIFDAVPRFRVCFSNWMFFGFAQWTRRKGVRVAVSSCVPQTAKAEFPNSLCPEFATHIPHRERAAEFSNPLIQFFFQGWKILEAPLFCSILNFVNYGWSGILTIVQY